MQKRGFVTIATGDYYCWLAESLYMSYKLFSNSTYPMYVITDKKGEKRLKKLFDGVIVVDDASYGWVDKILVYKNTVFEETIFLDADMHITNDISFLFDAFEKNGSEVSCLGEFRAITETVRPNHFGQAAVDIFNLDKYIAFGGGVYYFKQSKKAQECMDFIFNEIIPNYSKYDLLYIDGKMADEPLFGLSMLVNDMKPLKNAHYMRFSQDMIESLKWNFKNKDAQFIWHGEEVHPQIVHYATFNTWRFKYVRYHIKVEGLYRKTWKPFIWLKIVFAAIKWAFEPRQLKNFFKWVGAHFTIDYFKYRWGKIKDWFKKK